jgi:hypothetical protein
MNASKLLEQFQAATPFVEKYVAAKEAYEAAGKDLQKALAKFDPLFKTVKRTPKIEVKRIPKIEMEIHNVPITKRAKAIAKRANKGMSKTDKIRRVATKNGKKGFTISYAEKATGIKNSSLHAFCAQLVAKGEFEKIGPSMYRKVG